MGVPGVLAYSGRDAKRLCIDPVVITSEEGIELADERTAAYQAAGGLETESLPFGITLYGPANGAPLTARVTYNAETGTPGEPKRFPVRVYGRGDQMPGELIAAWHAVMKAKVHGAR